MTDQVVWGVYRELAHSPGRESDDARILVKTAEALGALGFPVALKTPEEVLESGEEPPAFLFGMCERTGILARLASWEEDGAVVVNSPEGVLNTYRDRTVACFARDRVPYPRTVLVSTASPMDGARELPACWVKRADVHCTEPGDVVFADRPDAVHDTLLALSRRGIAAAALQEHVAGDLIKFYGVGGEGDPEPWFVWFYHRDQELSRHRFDERELARAARLGARSLGLDVWGGDAIATPDGSVVLIDLNAWPSFALYREEAAPRIAAHLRSRFRAAVLPKRRAAAGGAGL
jgi:hypothetical protein